VTRIVILANSIEELGGAQRVVHVVAQGLAERGHDVELVGIAPHAPVHHYVESPAYRSRTLMSRAWPSPPSKGAVRLRSGRRTMREREDLRAEAIEGLGDLLRAGEPGVVVSAQLWAMEQLVDVPGFDWPVIGQYHSSYEAAAGGRDLARILALYRDVARFALLTPGDAARFRRRGMNNTTWIPNPLAVWPEMPADAGRSHTVLYLGRLSPEKGPTFLLEAWTAIAERHPEWSLRIVGSGPDEALVRKRIAAMGVAGERVVLEAPVADVEPVLRDAGILALPSLTEGLPLSLAEAMACGLATVATDCSDGVRLLAQGGETGVIVARGDAAALAAGLASLMDDGAARTEMGLRARAGVEEYRREPVLDRWEALVAEVLR
jgi:glycosyltransferase involved in cell wall biosynthesis